MLRGEGEGPELGARYEPVLHAAPPSTFVHFCPRPLSTFVHFCPQSIVY